METNAFRKEHRKSFLRKVSASIKFLVKILVPLIFFSTNRPFPSRFFTHTLFLAANRRAMAGVRRHTHKNHLEKGRKKYCVGAVIRSVESICYRFMCVCLPRLPLLNTFHSCNPICYSTPIIEVSA